MDHETTTGATTERERATKGHNESATATARDIMLPNVTHRAMQGEAYGAVARH